MPDREKVIDGIERLRFFNQRAGRELWGDKPTEIQNNDIADADNIFSDALALLKEQEPRVLSRSEAESYSEVADGYSEKNPLYVESKKPRPYNLKWATNEIVGAWMSDFEISRDYGIDFRFWTARPTEEQRKAATW